MGFFNKIFNRKQQANTGQKDTSDKTAEEKPLPGLRPGTVCELTVDGQKYMLDGFDLDFDRDGKGRYVPIYAVFADRLSPALESWVMRGDIRKDGQLRFYENTEKITGGAVFSMAFYNASCTGYRKTVKGEKSLTTLTLMTKRIKLLNEEYEMN